MKLKLIGLNMKTLYSILDLGKEDMGADMLLYQHTQNQTLNDKQINDLDIDVKELQQLINGYNEIQHIHGSMQTSIDEGVGLNPSCVQIAAIATEAIFDRLNIKRHDQIFLSLEMFKNKRTRLSSTRLSLESFLDHIKTMAKALVEAIKRIWKRVKEFFHVVFSNKDGIQNSLTSCLDSLKSIPHDAKPSVTKLHGPTISTESHASTTVMHRIPFGINGKCDFHTTKTIIEDTEILIKANKEIIAHIVKCLKVVVQTTDYNRLYGEVENLINEIKSSVHKLDLKSKKIDGHQELYTYGHLVAGQVCEIAQSIARAHNGEQVKLFNIRIAIKSGMQQTFEPELLKVPEMATIGKMAIELIEQSKDLDRLIPAIDSILESNINYLTTKLNEVSSERAKTVSQGIQLINDLFMYVVTILPKVSSDSNKVAINIGHYIKDCVSEYHKVVSSKLTDKHI